jgi:opacity protein-like surface antigen
MMRCKIISSLIGLVFSLSVFAQDFEGLNLSAAIGAQNYALQHGLPYDINGQPNGQKIDPHSIDSFGSAFNIEYDQKIDDHWLVGLQLSLTPFNSSKSASQVYDAGNFINEGKNQFKHIAEISLVVGYELNSKNMIYSKIGYSHADINWLDTGVNQGGYDKSFNGYCLGLGVRSFNIGEIMGNPNLYLFAEYDYRSYGMETFQSKNSPAFINVKIKSHAEMIGIGYQL